MTISKLNTLDQSAFVEAVGWIFEHSPWVAERACESRPFSSVDELHRAMVEQVSHAHRDEQLALLRAHPDLGTRARVSEASSAEQSGAGLDRLTPDELALFERLNSAYRLKFEFPFLLAVKGSSKHDILEALERRLPSNPGDEFAEALRQVYRIARFRLKDFITDDFITDDFITDDFITDDFITDDFITDDFIT